MIINPGAGEKSAYQYAVDGGYTGTEAEFQALMGTGPWLPVSGGTVYGEIAFSAPFNGVDVSNTFKLCQVQEYPNSMATYFSGWGFNGLILTDILHMGNNKITGLGQPDTGCDAAPKSYVDQTVAELNLPSFRQITVPSDKIRLPDDGFLYPDPKIVYIAMEKKANVQYVFAAVPDANSLTTITAHNIRFSGYSQNYDGITVGNAISFALKFSGDSKPDSDVKFNLIYWTQS